MTALGFREDCIHAAYSGRGLAQRQAHAHFAALHIRYRADDLVAALLQGEGRSAAAREGPDRGRHQPLGGDPGPRIYGRGPAAPPGPAEYRALEGHWLLPG